MNPERLAELQHLGFGYSLENLSDDELRIAAKSYSGTLFDEIPLGYFDGVFCDDFAAMRLQDKSQLRSVKFLLIRQFLYACLKFFQQAEARLLVIHVRHDNAAFEESFQYKRGASEIERIKDVHVDTIVMDFLPAVYESSYIVKNTTLRCLSIRAMRIDTTGIAQLRGLSKFGRKLHALVLQFAMKPNLAMCQKQDIVEGLRDGLLKFGQEDNVSLSIFTGVRASCIPPLITHSCLKYVNVHGVIEKFEDSLQIRQGMIRSIGLVPNLTHGRIAIFDENDPDAENVDFTTHLHGNLVSKANAVFGEFVIALYSFQIPLYVLLSILEHFWQYSSLSARLRLRIIERYRASCDSRQHDTLGELKILPKISKID